MRTNLILTLLMVFISCQSNIRKKDVHVQKAISIADKHNAVETHFKHHNDADVVVYKIDPNFKTDMDYGYAIVIYQSRGNGENYKIDFIVGSKDDYDKALYKWDNDSTLRMKLYSSTNNLSMGLMQILRKSGGVMSRVPYN